MAVGRRGRGKEARLLGGADPSRRDVKRDDKGPSPADRALKKNNVRKWGGNSTRWAEGEKGVQKGKTISPVFSTSGDEWKERKGAVTRQWRRKHGLSSSSKESRWRVRGAGLGQK